MKSYFERHVSPLMTTDAQGRTVPAIELTIAAWSEEDLLHFHDVSTEAEAVLRLNRAGFFIFTPTREIYRKGPDGRISHFKQCNFDLFFDTRRCGKRRISASTAWKRSDRRCEYDTIGYWPNNHGRPARSYNLWRSWDVDPVRGDWSPIYDYILNVLAAGDINTANYILDFCGHTVQRPWEKPHVALVFTGLTGSLRTLMTELLTATIGRRNVATTANDRRLFDKYNWNLADKLLIGAFSASKRQLDKLKRLLISDEIEVRQKYGHVIRVRALHRIIITLDHRQVIDASDDECRWLVCNVLDKRRGDDPYYVPLWQAVEGKNDALLASFMHELRTRDIANWKPEEAARKVSGVALARQNVLALDPPLLWLVDTLERTTKDGDPAKIDLSPGTWSLRRERPEMIDSYRDWAKNNPARNSQHYGNNIVFFPALRRFLNDRNFPGHKLEQKSGATYRWHMPTRKEMKEGLNRFLGGDVVDEHP